MSVPAVKILKQESFCERHGSFMSKGISIGSGEPFWSHCPECSKERINTKTKAAVLLEKQQFSFIPERFRHETFDTYLCTTEKQRRVVQYLREYRGDKNIIIHGNPGTGKTHLLWALIKANPEARYRKISDIIRQVKCSFSPTVCEGETEILNKLAGVKILVIDEIGRQTKSNFEMNLIFDLIDMRYNTYRATILCSNLPITGEESITSYIGVTAMDRINENAIELYCDWANYRKK